MANEETSGIVRAVIKKEYPGMRGKVGEEIPMAENEFDRQAALGNVDNADTLTRAQQRGDNTGGAGTAQAARKQEETGNARAEKAEASGKQTKSALTKKKARRSGLFSSQRVLICPVARGNRNYTRLSSNSAPSNTAAGIANSGFSPSATAAQQVTHDTEGYKRVSYYARHSAGAYLPGVVAAAGAPVLPAAKHPHRIGAGGGVHGRQCGAVRSRHQNDCVGRCRRYARGVLDRNDARRRGNGNVRYVTRTCNRIRASPGRNARSRGAGTHSRASPPLASGTALAALSATITFASDARFSPSLTRARIT